MMKITIEHLTRLEGHGHLVIDASNGKLIECRLDIVEVPRFFEGLLQGRHFSDVAPIVARICGVCSNSHSLVSLAATEQALGVDITDQTKGLRTLLAFGEILQSHLLHLYFMAAPDYLGVSSLLPLAKKRRELVMRALRLKRLGNEICEVIGGRAVHPVTLCVGGFSSLPETTALQNLRRRLVDALPDLEATVELFAGFTIPSFSRDTEFLSLTAENAYPLDGDTLVSSDGIRVPVAEYQTVVEEYLVPHSTAKFARASRDTLMVGPLARIKNGLRFLSPMGRSVAAAVELDPATLNPFKIVLARLVEVVHCVEEGIHLIDALLQQGLRRETPQVMPRAGHGAAAIEAPRGTLIHAYEYDRNGCVIHADCLIPTAQNLANIEADLRELIPTLLDLPREDLSRQLQMLVRSYDPCISCSTHLLNIDFV